MALGMIQMVLPAITKTIDRKESRNEQFHKLSDFDEPHKQSRVSRHRTQFCWLWIIFIITGRYSLYHTELVLSMPGSLVINIFLYFFDEKIIKVFVATRFFVLVKNLFEVSV